MRFTHTLVIGAALQVAATTAWGFTVSGTVRDAAGTPIPHIKLFVYKQSSGVDPVIATTYADASGAYFSDAVSTGTTIYVQAGWGFALQPDPLFPGTPDVILDSIGVEAAIPGLEPYVPVDSAVISNVQADVTADITMLQVAPAGLTTLVERIQRTLDYVRDNRGSVVVNTNYNISVSIALDDRAFFSSDDEMLTLPDTSFNGLGNAFDEVTLFHEMGHLMHYFHNGETLPNIGAGCEQHSVSSEESRSCALVEGYASYIGQLVSEEDPVIFSSFFASYRDPFSKHWRGGLINSDPGSNPTGLDGSTYESGEQVEGAVAGILFGISNEPDMDFSSVLKVMVESKPNDVVAFRPAFVTHIGGGPDMPRTRKFYEIMQRHGVVHNRLRFAADPFSSGSPPLQAPTDTPPPPGNNAVIDGVLFLRGTVSMVVADVLNSTLGTTAVLTNPRGRLAALRAADGLEGDTPSSALSMTDFFNTSTPVSLDTTILPFDGAAGDWDLILVGENPDGFSDNFLPTWNEDANPLVNTDERYLKKIGTWYDEDSDPETNTAAGGKVIVDNTAPVVTVFRP